MWARLPQVPSKSGKSLNEKTGKSRNSSRLSGGGVGAEGIQVNLATDRHPRTNTESSQIVFAVTSVALTLERLGTQLLGLPAQFLMVIPSTLVSSVSWAFWKGRHLESLIAANSVSFDLMVSCSSC